MAEKIRRLSGATVFVSSRELDQCRHPTDSLSQRWNLLLEAGVPERTLEELTSVICGETRWVTPLIEAEEIKQDHTFSFEGGVELKPLFTPGHTVGHVCYYEVGSRNLFSGDHLLDQITPNPLVGPAAEEAKRRTQNLVQYLDTLARLQDLDVQKVFPAHGGPVEDYRGLIKQVVDHHWARAGRIAGILGDQELTAYEIAQALFPALEGYDIVLGVCEVLGHLDLLLDKGVVTESGMFGEVHRYRKVHNNV